MFSNIANIHEKLRDPLIARPLLTLISHNEKNNPDILWIKEHGFTPAVIEHLLTHAPWLKYKLFTKLETAHFSNCKQWFQENWPHSDIVTARWGASIYAQIDPVNAASAFREYLNQETELQFDDCDDSDDSDDDDDNDDNREINHATLSGILSAIRHLPNEYGTPLIDLILKKINHDDAFDQLNSDDESALIEIAWTYQHAELASLLSNQLIFDKSIQLFDTLFKCIAQQSPWLDYIDAISFGNIDACLKDIKQIFEDDFNAELFDSYLVGDDDLDYQQIIDLFNKIPEKNDSIIFTKKILAPLLTETNTEECQYDLIVFAIAINAFLHEKKQLNLQQVSLEDTIQYAYVKPIIDHHANELIQHLSLFQKEQVITSCIKEFETKLDAFDTSDAFDPTVEPLVILMGKTKYHEFIEPLISAIDYETAYRLSEIITNALIDIGMPAKDYCIDYWNKLNNTQQIYARAIIEAMGGHKIADFVINHFKEFFDEDDDALSFMMMYAPDIRYIPLLESTLTEYIQWIDDAFYFNCKLFDYPHPELENVRQRITAYEDNVRKQLSNASHLKKKDSLLLSLQCSECQQVSYYQINKVYCFSKEDLQPTVSGEHTCKHCNRLTTLVCTPFAETIIWRRLNIGDRSDFADKTNEIKFSSAKLRNGYVTSIPDALKYAENQVDINSQSAIEWLCLGNIYRNLDYFQKALHAYQQCWDINKSFVEAINSSAEILEKQGNSIAAFKLLQEALNYQNQWRLYRVLEALPFVTFGESFSNFYNFLRDKLQLNDTPRLPNNFLNNVVDFNITKLGRNDRCHCGSGKKYKKCCM